MYYMLGSCSIGGKRRARAPGFYAAANGKGQQPIRARPNNIIFTDSAALGATMKRKRDTELGVNDIPCLSEDVKVGRQIIRRKEAILRGSHNTTHRGCLLINTKL